MKARFSIQGMHCASCVSTIEHAVKKCFGVEKAHVNFAKETLQVEYDERKVSEKEIEQAVSRVGYKLLSYEEKYEKIQEAKSKTIQKLKRLFFLSLSLSIPIFLLSFALLGIDIPYEPYILLLLAIPVQLYVGFRFMSGHGLD